MHPLTIFVLVACSSSVISKNGVKSLTESLGQEVIEIETPIKELPADLEEEPSIENEENEHVTTASPITTATTTKLTTRKETKKPTPPLTSIRPRKSNVILSSEDEEDRIEKELAEIYKDTIDYKDSAETTLKVVTKVAPAQNTTRTELTTTKGNSSKPILRSNDRENFKFQPDPFNKAEIERFRTSVDDISCGKKLKADEKNKPSKDSSYKIILNIFVFNVCLFVKILI